MYLKKEEYNLMLEKASPKSHKAKDFFMAFSVGGTVCVIGELLRKLYIYCGADEKTAPMCVALSLIFISAFLTGIKVFQKISGFAGAGVLIPITGFANAVVSPAIEFKTEGYILGVGAKIFSIAGPVILYGTVASVIYGIIYYVLAVLL